MRTATAILILLAAAWAWGLKPPAAAEPAVKAEEVKLTTIPNRGGQPPDRVKEPGTNLQLPAPDARGKAYPVPPTNWEQRPVLWGWTCELPDGSGLAFGGCHQTADDGNPHTSVKEGGQWKPIVEELRKANPLQKRFEQVRELRNACKDALARARHIFFEGKPADEEAKLLTAGVDPAVEKLAKDLAALAAELKGLAGLGEYETGQVKLALKHLDAAAALLKPFGGRTSPEQLATMRKAQIELEIAAEPLDAEPAPRALSLIAFEPKTRLYVIFGGEHMDYVTNDLWVFDPVKRRWFQRRPEAAPEPRGDHHFDPLGDGRIAMRGGYTYSPRPTYVHVGPARWIYDVEKDAWSADGHQEKTFPPDMRSSNYWPPSGPEAFMKGPRPDAAANEAKLKALPVNTWVNLQQPVALWRVWGTVAFDADRDLFYVFAGGHGSYGGGDVARYHLATNRWEQSEPSELPLGGTGSNEQYPSGVNFNLRPWVKKHTYNSYAYDPEIKKMILAGVNDATLDPYFYLYDPDKADWTSRHRIPAGMGNGCGSAQLRYTKHGMLNWCPTRNPAQGAVWLFNEKDLEWKKIAIKGSMPAPSVDACGMVYDPKRDRMLFLAPGYGQPYNGQIYALDFATSQVAPLNPEGMDDSKTWWFFPREVAYHPESDLFIWDVLYQKNANCHAPPFPNLFPAYDSAKNRWVLAKIAVGAGVQNVGGVSGFMVYDAKRGLFWSGELGYGGGVWAMRFDPAKAEITALKDFVPPAAPAGEKK
jgi:hypothetical protein